ncbi:FkbM family methyltransferase [Haladaptatus sp. NG-WS-4]
MASKKLTRGALRAGRRILSTPPLQQVIDRLGLQVALSQAYWELLFRSSGGTHVQRIGDTSVTFEAATADEFRHYRTLVDERPVLADLLSRLEPDDVFYDVGGYIGCYTCLAAAALPAGQVVTFEPRASKAARIEANLARNDLSADVRREALSDETGEATMAIDGVAQLSTRGTEQVVLMTGDELVERSEIPPPTVLKIDVEGAERDTIAGLEETLSRGDCRLVYCEVHPTFLDEYGASEDDVRAALEACGFTVETMHDRGAEYFLRAEKA